MLGPVASLLGYGDVTTLIADGQALIKAHTQGNINQFIQDAGTTIADHFKNIPAEDIPAAVAALEAIVAAAEAPTEQTIVLGVAAGLSAYALITKSVVTPADINSAAADISTIINKLFPPKAA